MVAVPSAQPGELDLAEAAGLSPGDVLARLGSSLEGLQSAEAVQRLRRYGPNALATHRVRPAAVLFRQVRNPILLLLLGAALVSGLTGGGTNALIIAVIVALSVGLGFSTSTGRRRRWRPCATQIRHEAEVSRDGQASRIPVLDLVPGDVVSPRIGDIVPADLRLLTVDGLECDEGVLTGESMPAVKTADAVARHQGQDQPGCASMGTVVHQGSATGVVVRTGTGTVFGQIAGGPGR
jgi:Mg2+-importing ATPase